MKVASDLLGRGVKVDIFEAGTRVGGRTLTARVGDESVDLGAEAFEAGEESAWLREFADQTLLPPNFRLVDPFSGIDRGLYWYPEGKLRREDDVARLFIQPRAKAVVAQFEANTLSAQDIAVSKGADLSSLDARVAFHVSHFSAFSESAEPSRYSAQDRSRNGSEGADLRPFVENRLHGIGSLFAAYGNLLRSRGVAFRMPVTIKAIERRLEGGWSIRLADFAEEAYDAVVVTVSAGVLSREELPLPASIRASLRRALEGIELGAYAKVAFHWPAAADKLGTKPVIFFYVDREGTSAWQVSKLENSAVLVVAVAGSTAQDLDTQRCTEMAAEVVRLTVRPSEDAEQVVVSGWIPSPLFRGAYSYSRAGAGAARPALVEAASGLGPLGLFFAGEALSLKLYGSLEATWYTGDEAAKRCATYLKVSD